MSNVSIEHESHESALTDSFSCVNSSAMREELETVRRKKVEAAKELASLEERRVQLEQWVRDLTTTERTLARICDVDLPEPEVRQTDAYKRKKPKDIPSVFDMAATIIRDRGMEFVEANDILNGIKTRWWPDATNNDISPSLWRLATKDDRLRKEGTKYALPLPRTVAHRMGAPV